MVSGLIIRKTFIVIDLALAALVVVVVGLVAMEMTRVIPGPDAVLAAQGNTDEPTAQPLPQVADRAAYASLRQSGLFGEAGKWDPKAIPPPAPVVPEEKPPEPDVSETTLNLRLMGTIALGSGSKFSTAFIENLDANDRGRGYFIGDQVMENVTLEEVLSREVIVLNKRFDPPKRERLKMDEAESTPGATASASPKSAAPAPGSAPGSASDPSSSDRVNLKRDEIVQELYKNYSDLVTNLKPEMARDDKGNVIGITAPNIGQVPMAQKLGLKDNDILQTVNNEQIDSEQKIIEMVQKYQTANSFRIGIMRDGKPKVITYRLD
jgi:type II secretory pathway component PulC